ncbi:MAG: hypothetical protein NZ602_09815 [Thermoguttaceae bacterium]|nr:hypothetical protein [Thermoguttaceae bacterium]MDW8037232.1 hypothetical protein [Thermoguttaceae bacterium]
MGRIGIVSFAASYGAALVLEVWRWWFRSRLRAVWLVVLGTAGLIAHSVFLGYRAATVTGSPLSSEMDWCLLAAWLLVAIYLVLVFSYPRTPFGLVLLPLALGLIGLASGWASRQPYSQPAASKVWGLIHAGAILLATVAVLVAFTAGLLYLVQAYRLKHRRAPLDQLWLPSLEWLERMNLRAMTVAVGALGVGFFGGIVLNWINYQQQVPPLPWSDPLVMTTLAMFWWLLVALAITIWYRPADEVRKVAFVTMVSFVFLIMALVALLMMDTSHGRTRNPWIDENGRAPVSWAEADSSLGRSYPELGGSRASVGQWPWGPQGVSVPE